MRMLWKAKTFCSAFAVFDIILDGGKEQMISGHGRPLVFVRQELLMGKSRFYWIVLEPNRGSR